MTTKKQTPAELKPKAKGWMDDLQGFAETARETVFKAKQAFFTFASAGRGSGQGLAVICNARIVEPRTAAEGEPSRRVLVRIPADLDAKMREKISGSQTVALVALAEWALEQLDERRETLTINNKQ